MQEMAKRGIAIHHSGVLPILRESVELLFQTGRIKVLFATETFASECHFYSARERSTVGICSGDQYACPNCPCLIPCKSTMDEAFANSYRVNRSWRETETELVFLGEYIQMAGRAGRRGVGQNRHCHCIVQRRRPFDRLIERHDAGEFMNDRNREHGFRLVSLRSRDDPLNFNHNFVWPIRWFWIFFAWPNAPWPTWSPVPIRNIIAKRPMHVTSSPRVNSVRRSKHFGSPSNRSIPRPCNRISIDVNNSGRRCLVFSNWSLIKDRTSHRFLDDLLQCGRIIRIRDLYDIDVPAMVLDGSFSSSGKAVNQQRIISVLVISRSKNRSLTDIDRLILKENEAMFVLPVRKWKLDDSSGSQEDWLYQIKNIHLTDILDITKEVMANVNYRDILEGHWNHRTTDEIDIQHESTIANDKALKKTIEKLKTVREAHSDQSSKCSHLTLALEQREIHCIWKSFSSLIISF